MNSMTVADVGVPLRTTAVLLRFFAIAPNLVMCPLISVGFWMMVTGQSVVLYSRLNLIVGDPQKMRWTAALIATTFICLELPTSAFFIASNIKTSLNEQPKLVHVFDVLEYVQTACLSFQESLIGIIYVLEAMRALKPMRPIKGDKVRMMIKELVAQCVLVILLDMSLMVVEYNGNYFSLQTTYKGVIYSIKLQVEAIVLNNLTSLVRQQPCTCHSTPADNFSSQITHQPSSRGRLGAKASVPPANTHHTGISAQKSGRNGNESIYDA